MWVSESNETKSHVFASTKMFYRWTLSSTSTYNYWQDGAKRQTTGIKFTHRPKISFFALQGRLVAPIHVKLSRADGHIGPLGCAKFHLNRHRGGNAATKYQKFPLFGTESPLPWPIWKIFRGFYTPDYPTLAFQISCDSHHRLRSYCWETARRSVRPNFSVHPVRKTMHWIKNESHLLMGTTCSITMQSLGEIAQCAPAVGP